MKQLKKLPHRRLIGHVKKAFQDQISMQMAYLGSIAALKFAMNQKPCCLQLSANFLKNSSPFQLKIFHQLRLSKESTVNLPFQHQELVKESEIFREMGAQKMDALKGKVEQIKSEMEGKFSTIKGRFFNYERSFHPWKIDLEG
ncbi:hypothetical protein IEQ34_016844 [Dendrobium chrysotoxum]|uniref:Uncharacterized protein n=1 Tax=Dendrobium chrysotoxum TaxID=161865 RepID=A0AAV7FYS3_DENCH|nr:hypothetical protein IEQ34_016844 [Dendrobium chrysotoxum]